MADKSRIADTIEWALGLAAAAGVAAIIGYLGWQGLAEAGLPPELSVEPLASGAEGRVAFVARNRGGATATDVSIVLRLHDDAGAVVAEHALTIDYLPAHSEVTGAFVLPPGTGGLTRELAVEGYVDP